MAQVTLHFPTPIYVETELISEEENDRLAERCLQIKRDYPDIGNPSWVGNTYNTYGTNTISEDPLFERVVRRVGQHVQQFANLHNSKHEFHLQNGWINVNTKNTFQEYHAHQNSVFSCVYYVRSPAGAGGIRFLDPKYPTMLTMPDEPDFNELTSDNVLIEPQERMLIIFRSYLMHMVMPCENNDPRVSLALNYR